MTVKIKISEDNGVTWTEYTVATPTTTTTNVVPAPGTPPATDTTSTTASTTTTGTTTTSTAPTTKTYTNYTVVTGDTLSVISSKTGVPWQDIAAANNLVSPYTIYLGQILKIPTTTTGTSTTTVSPSPTPTPAPTGTAGRISLMNLPLWSNKPITWAAVSDVTVFQYIPNQSGGWAYGNAAYDIPTMIKTAHSNGKKISISLGGWLGAEGGVDGAGWFPTIFKSASLRSTSIDNVVNEVKTKGYDGVKVDVEGDINALITAGFFTWMSELRTKLKAANPNYFIHWDVFASWTGPVRDGHQYADKILVMNFNGTAVDPASTMPALVTAVGSANKNKLVVGLGLHHLDGPTLDKQMGWTDTNGYVGYMFWSCDLATTEDWQIIQKHYTRPLVDAPLVFVGVGSSAAATNASVSPGLPSSLQPGDLLVAYVTARGNGTISTPTGWTSKFQEQQRATDNLHKAALFYKVYASGDSAPTFNYTSGAANDTVIGQICAFQNVDSANPFADTTTASNNATAQNIGAITGFTPTNAGPDGGVIVLGHKADDWTSVATLTGDSLTWVEIGEPSSTLGTDAGQVWNYAFYSGAAPTITSKTFTVTGGATNTGAGKMVSLRKVRKVAATHVHTVTSGESLSSIGDMEGCSAFDIASYNGVAPPSYIIFLDQALKISSEKVGITEAVNKVVTPAGLTLIKNVSTEAVGITEAVNKALTQVRNVTTESVGITEAVNKALTLSRNVTTEAVGITEAVNKLTALSRVPSAESVALTEAVNYIVARTRVVTAEQEAITESLNYIRARSQVASTENVGVTESVNSALAKVRTTATEIVSISELLNTTRALVRDVDELVASTEFLNYIRGRSQNVAVEQVGLTESLNYLKNSLSVSNESLGITEAINYLLARARVADESLGITELVVTAMARTRDTDEQESITELVNYLRARSAIAPTESVTVTEILNRTLSQVRFPSIDPETVNLTEQVNIIKREFVIPPDESVSISENVITALAKSRVLNESVDITEDVNVHPAKVRVVDESVGITEAVNSALAEIRVKDESLDIGETVNYLASKVRTIATESLGITESVNTLKSQGTNVSESVPVSEQIITTLARVREADESLDITEQLNYIRARLRQIDETVELTESLNYLKNSALTVSPESLDITESTNYLRSRLVLVPPESVGIAESVNYTLAEVRLPEDTVTITELVNSARSLVRQVDELVANTESLNLTRALVRLPQDDASATVGITEQINGTLARGAAPNDETIPITEQISAALARVRTTSTDQLGITEQVNYLLAEARVTGQESLDITEQINHIVAKVRNVDTEQLSVTELANGTLAEGRVTGAESISISEQINRVSAKTRVLTTEQETIAELINKALRLSRIVNETEATTESVIALPRAQITVELTHRYDIAAPSIFLPPPIDQGVGGAPQPVNRQYRIRTVKPKIISPIELERVRPRPVSASLTCKYGISNFVTKEIGFEYKIEQEIVVYLTTKTLKFGYDIRNYISSGLPSVFNHLYNIRNNVKRAFTHNYKIRNYRLARVLMAARQFLQIEDMLAEQDSLDRELGIDLLA